MAKDDCLDNNSRILEYVNGLLRYYGLIKKEELLKVIHRTLQLDVNEQDLLNLIRQVKFENDLDEDGFPLNIDHDEHYFFHADAVDFPEIISKQNSRKGLAFRALSEKEAQAANTFMLKTARDRYMKRIAAFLSSKGWPDEAVRDCFNEAVYMLNKGEQHLEIIKMFITDTEFKSEKELNELIDALTGFINHTPLWELKGWTPAEVRNMNLEPEPQPEAPSRQQSLFDRDFIKVGRNDPCPCGSGKKYKKCCGSSESPAYELSRPDEAGKAAEAISIAHKKPEATSAEETKGSQKPALEEWRALYSAAIEFNKIKCWNWMFEDDIFGIQNPETGEIAFCSILGFLGEAFALNAYRGLEGLMSYENFREISGQSGTADKQDIADAFFKQKSLSATFENRDALDDKDLAVIKELGLKIRGKNQWPQFRSYEPGLYPWYLTSADCRFLTLILQQALEIVLSCSEDKAVLSGRKANTILVRARQGSGKKEKWVNTYRQVEFYGYDYKSFKINDELYLRKILNLAEKKDAEWEADTFFTEGPVQDKKNERPYFPTMFLLVDCRSGLVIRFDLITKIENESYRIIDKLIDAIKSYKTLPQTIYVAKRETYLYLHEVCEQLGVDLIHVEKLRLMPSIKKELSRFSRGR